MKINETRKRSLLKGLTQRAIEVAVDTVILSLFVTPHIALTLAVVIELLCGGSHYINERMWNRTDYGRNIIEQETLFSKDAEVLVQEKQGGKTVTLIDSRGRHIKKRGKYNKLVRR